ncbi:hypothetical protein BZA05DRAFT_400796 [Tricharina praecox]|uniref:uncharacterized protein n=1 Tax=Tricharina praecox TaxID=43433 RepID=UPI00221FD18B|nr:uncharacterized protein BZA05DRAFT_400796 [Tricharina praecox]KAI5850070.1 hypothetical protein BZA05DRAFT_400796 [Tricharina praecox]
MMVSSSLIPIIHPYTCRFIAFPDFAYSDLKLLRRLPVLLDPLINLTNLLLNALRTLFQQLLHLFERQMQKQTSDLVGYQLVSVRELALGGHVLGTPLVLLLGKRVVGGGGKWAERGTVGTRVWLIARREECLAPGEGWRNGCFSGPLVALACRLRLCLRGRARERCQRRSVVVCATGGCPSCIFVWTTGRRWDGRKYGGALL